MNENEYGIKLDLDLSKFNSSIDEAQGKIDKLRKNTARKVKVSGVDGLEEIKIGIDTEEVEKATEKIKSVKERLESGDIKVTGVSSGLTDEEYKKSVAEYQKMIDKMAGPVDASFMGYDKNFMKDLNDEFKNIDTSQLEQADDDVRDIGTESKKSKGSLINLGIGIKNITKNLVNLDKFKGVFKNITRGFNNGMRSVKRFALSLIGVQSAYRIVTRAVSAYMSYDSDLQKSMQQTWAGLGSFLAPMLEYVVALFQKLLAYANAVVKAFTGIDFVARANAKALEKQAKAAQKTLAPFDEINNLSQEQDTNQIKIPTIESSGIQNFADEIKKQFEEGDYYGVGQTIGRKITEALAGINWSSIKAQAKKIGVGISQSINGFLNETDWSVVGQTIADGINTGINFAYGFVTEFDWSQFGSAIGTSLYTSFTGIDWETLGQTISDGIAGIFTSFGSVLENINWIQVATDIETFFKNIDWGKIARSIFTMMGKALASAVLFLGTFIIDLGKEVGDYFSTWIEIAKENGGNIFHGLLMGIMNASYNIVEWLRKNVFEPFINGFKELFGIHSPSTVMAELGMDIINGVLESLRKLPGKALEVFNNLKTKVKNKLTEISTDARTKATDIGTKIKDGITNSLSNLGEVLRNLFKSPLNTVIGLVNSMINKINSKLSIRISDTIAEVLNALGVGVSAGRYQLFSIPNVPYLNVGTDLVKDDGLAYLHAGEKVVPADVAGGGYSADNSETNELLRQLIDMIDNKDFNPYITVDDIGKASTDYQRHKARILGGEF